LQKQKTGKAAQMMAKKMTPAKAARAEAILAVLKTQERSLSS
jgi:hypothetical protein